MEAVCRAALARGMSEIAITDHADYEPLDACHGYFRPAPYWEEMNRCRALFAGQLAIRAGVECGESYIYREPVAALLAAHSYDVVLGSLHWADGRPTYAGDFFDGLGLDEGLALYFDHLARLAAEGEFDVLGHLDIIRRATALRFGIGELDLRRHEARVRQVLRLLAGRGKGLEVNTSFVRKGIGGAGPSLEVLRWFRQEGGQIVTLGSDAHRPEDVGGDLDRGLALLRQAGFERLATFERRSVVWIALTDFSQKGE